MVAPAGSATWDTAPRIRLGESSTPSPIGDYPVGDFPPYFSAWWKVIVNAEMEAFFHNPSTVATGDLASSNLIVYTEDAILAATDQNPDFADYVGYAYANEPEGRVSVAVNLLPGVTYYVRLGATTAVADDSGIVAHVLTADGIFWTPWHRPAPAEATSSAYAPGSAKLSYRARSASMDDPTPFYNVQNFRDVFQTAFENADLAGTISTVDVSEAPSASLGLTCVGTVYPAELDLSGSEPAVEKWHYEAQGNDLAQEIVMRTPTPDYSEPPRSEWPEGALAVEVDSTSEPVLVNLRLDWDYQSGDYDNSGSREGNPDALGMWDHMLCLESRFGDFIAVVQGALPYGERVSGTAELSLGAYPPGTDMALAITRALGAVTPGPFSDHVVTDDGGWAWSGSYQSSGSYQPRIVLRFLPPLVRYRVLGIRESVSWWDGADRQAAYVLGWWDGDGVQPATHTGWWSGADIQPTLPFTTT